MLQALSDQFGQPVSQSQPGLQELLAWQEPRSAKWRGHIAVSVVVGPMVGSEPSPPASFPTLPPNSKYAKRNRGVSLSALQASPPGRQGYLGQE